MRARLLLSLACCSATAFALAEDRKKDAPKPDFETTGEAIVEGTVARTQKTKDDFFVIELEGSAGHVVRCTVDERDYKAAKKGDKVAIKGDCSSHDDKEKSVTVNTAFVLKKG